MLPVEISVSKVTFWTVDYRNRAIFDGKIRQMKSNDRLSSRFKQPYLEDLVMIGFMVMTAGMVSLIPLIFSIEIANSSAHNPVWGEAGLWRELGSKD